MTGVYRSRSPTFDLLRRGGSVYRPELPLGGTNKQPLRIVCAYLFVHSYLMSEILKLALTGFYKVLILVNYKRWGMEGTQTSVGGT